jgi:hypothetical protein
LLLTALQASLALAQDKPQPPAVGEAPSAPTAEEVARREQGALLRAKVRTIELGISYSRSERENFPIARFETTSATATITGRYGIKDDLQLTGRLPFVYTHSRTLVAGPTGLLSSTTDDGYTADTSLSLLGIGVREALGRPNVLWSIDAVLPTGPGDRGLGASAIFSKSFDPAVLFGSVAYLRGFALDASNLRRQLPKDSVRLTLGYTYAINDSLALNTLVAWTNRNVPAAPPNTLPVSRTRQQVQLGATWMLKPGLFLEPVVAFSVGGSTPDATFSLNVPYTF